MKLFAITRALAGAIKAVIDTPVLSTAGDLDTSSYNKYIEINGQLSNFKTVSESVSTVNYGVKLLPAKKA